MWLLALEPGISLYHLRGELRLRAAGEPYEWATLQPFVVPEDRLVIDIWLDELEVWLARHRDLATAENDRHRESHAAATRAAEILRAAQGSGRILPRDAV